MVEFDNITLTGTQQTALATLYARAQESSAANSILGDSAAIAAVDRLNYDFSTLHTSRRDQKTTAVRAKAYDSWARRFLAAEPTGVILNLGCGLDTRVYRVDPPATARWYDIDLPDVVALRRRLFPGRVGLHTISSSVTDPDLLSSIPGNVAVLVIAEGLTPYLPAVEGISMLNRIVEQFPQGDLVFDGYSTLGVKITQHYGPVKSSGARLDWAINDPHELETSVPGLQFISESLIEDVPDVERHFAWSARQAFRLISGVTPLRRLGRRLHYHFDHTEHQD
jgi:O-methyltransferase involved in polyketide biosynthesis